VDFRGTHTWARQGRLSPERGVNRSRQLVAERGAAPARPASSAGLPGGFGTPPCRYYGRCARCSLTARS